MKKIASIYFRYVGFWLLYFVLIRALFIIYHCLPFANEKISEVVSSFIYGMRMDLSMASYISIVPLLLIGVFSFYLKPLILNKILNYYSWSLITIISFLVIIDMELFSFWGYRLDGTPLKYLNTPAEMLASSLSSPWYILIPLLIVLIWGSFFLYNKIVINYYEKVSESILKVKPLFFSLITILFIGFLPISIRGGLQQIPMNESTVYFSSSNLVNQATMNLPWTFLHSLLEKSYSEENPYVFMEYKEANAVTSRFFDTKNDSVLVVLDTAKTNVVIILWESFTAKADIDSVTPVFNKLKKEGLFFDSIYASGDRSDKGIVAVLSGYPALSSASVILNPNKSLKLPSLVKNFTSKGYNSSFYYGGELAFANLNSYLVQNKFSSITSKNDFDSKDMNSKWGAHDEVVLNRLNEELAKTKAPFLSMVFTLSSHEPFEIPMKSKFKGNDKTTMFLNSLNYTDKCLGEFIEKAKKSTWWKNSVVIIIADHGHVLPGGHYANHRKEEFKIPMLWLGGALKLKDSVITKIASQSDLAATLLGQFGIKDSCFTFSRNILSTKYKEGAYYSYNNGFGFVFPSGEYCFDNISNNFTFIKSRHRLKSSIAQNAILQGKAIQQVTFQNYLDK